MGHEAVHVFVHVVFAFVLFFVLLLSFLAYLIPSFIAFLRGHRHRVLIAILNVLFGWSLVGWLICAIWACTAADSPRE